MWTEQKLESLLTQPSAALVEDMKKIEGDIAILGAGGKMGPTLAILAANACKQAGLEKKVYAISRFSNKELVAQLEAYGIIVLPTDLSNPEALAALPYIPNIIYMAGKKFGTDGNESETWCMNVSVPTLVSQKFRGAKFVVFSSGNIYPKVPVVSGGCDEKVKPVPLGEYAMSTLGRERVFEHACKHYGSSALLYRLNYAVDLRYGVLYDLAKKIIAKEAIDLTSGNFNCVWQGYANEVALRSLLHTQSPAAILNITGPETVSVRYAAEALGKKLGIAPSFYNSEADTAYLNNAAKCFSLFGYPSVSLSQLIDWQVEWIQSGGRSLEIPTHFEEREGSY